MNISQHGAVSLLAEHAIDGLLAVDEDGVVIEANPAARALLGLPTDPTGIAFGRPPLEGEEVELEFRGGRIVEMRARSAELDGRLIWVLVLRDVTLRREADANRRVEEQRLQYLFESTGSSYVDLDLSTGQVTLSSAAAEQLGLDPRQHAHPMSGLLSAFTPRDAVRFEGLVGSLDEQTGVVEFEYSPAARPGQSLTLTGKVIRTADGRALRLVGLQSDTSAMLERLTALEVHACTDPLTGLANRKGMARWLETAEGPVGLIAIDLDGFKAVNDTHGHAAGDDLLTVVAGRLTHSTRGGDLVARIGGDEFVVLVSRSTAPVLAEMVARISRALNTGAVKVGDELVTPSASVGAATALTAADVPCAALEADRAMYHDKRSRSQSAG